MGTARRKFTSEFKQEAVRLMTEQGVPLAKASHPSSREAHTYRQLWNKIPLSYCRGLIFTDFYQEYQAVVPQKQHRPGGKDQGQTNRVERFDLTLRQRVGRLTRKMLSFSKQHLWHYEHQTLLGPTQPQE